MATSTTVTQLHTTENYATSQGLHKTTLHCTDNFVKLIQSAHSATLRGSAIGKIM